MNSPIQQRFLTVFFCVCFSAAHKQDKLSLALQRVELQTEEATVFQKRTNDKILLIKV